MKAHDYRPTANTVLIMLFVLAIQVFDLALMLGNQYYIAAIVLCYLSYNNISSIPLFVLLNIRIR